MVFVTVKWNKTVLEKVPLDPTQPVATFNDVLFKLTNVPVDRQKLMAKGLWSAFLKPDASFASMNIPEGTVITLMGTADVVAAPAVAVSFVEDMTEKEKAVVGVTAPPGLVNLGNTCYLNSTLQCIKNMPEIREKISHVTPSHGEMPFVTKQLFDEMDSKTGQVIPGRFVRALRTHYPLFDEKKEHAGHFHYVQQDAEELFNVVTNALDMASRDGKPLFHLETEQRLSCQEAPQEPVSVTKEIKNKLVCMIQGTNRGTTSINHMADGIKLWMNGQVEKRSAILGRDALWQSTSRISKLPKYICVQFMRFYWKETPTDQNPNEGTKCKIMRDIKFPETFNVFDFCTEQLQAVLQKNRIKSSDLKDSMLGGNASESSNSASASSTSASGGGGSAMDTSIEEDEDLKQALRMSVEEGSSSTPNVFNVNSELSFFDSGVPSDTVGNYDLHSIVTHKGQSADGGHYMGYARQGKGSSSWWKYDDDTVTETTTDAILKYSGGGDINTAYLAFYRIRD